MKCFFGLCLLMSLPVAFAVEFKVNGYKKSPGMDRSFVLKTTLAEKVVLDCQSFIQGLTIGNDLVMMDAQGCEELYFRIEASIKKHQKHCLDVEEEIRHDYTCL